MHNFALNMKDELAKIWREQNRVEKNIRHFNATRLNKLVRSFKREGVKQFHALFMSMAKLHFPNAEKTDDLPRILRLQLQRHILRWEQNVDTALATAKDTIPEFRNKVRAKEKDGTRASILARLDRALGGEGFEPSLNKQGGRSLYGKARLNQGRNRKVLIRLAPYLKLLMENSPRNFQREFKLDLLRAARQGRDKILIKISGGIRPNSCTTCRGLTGRVLTEDAHKYATEFLNPPLYHPNCNHIAHTGGMQGVTLATYDERVHGKLITLPEIHRMVSAGILNKGRKRRAFVRT